MIIPEQLERIQNEHRLPLFVYDAQALKIQAQELIALEIPYGKIVRYAVKANPHPKIIDLFDDMDLHFDACSTYEAKMLLDSGIDPNKISLSSQSLEGPLKEVADRGVLLVATSLNQLSILVDFGITECGLRVNPGIGSGHNNRTNVGGPASSFGLWYEYLDQAMALAKEENIKITRLHTHIGSGADPGVWRSVIQKSLDVAEQLKDVTSLDIGGGFKVARMPDEVTTDMTEVFRVFSEELTKFANKAGRKLQLEIEPGTYLVANAGTLLTRVVDIVDTGRTGYTFVRLNTGMNDILRPSIYGAQHPIEVLNDETERKDYIFVGHNCESGDILTPAPGDPEGLQVRTTNQAHIGDVVAIGGAGAYCASMSTKGYNSFPTAQELLI